MYGMPISARSGHSPKIKVLRCGPSKWPFARNETIKVEWANNLPTKQQFVAAGSKAVFHLSVSLLQ